MLLPKFANAVNGWMENLELSLDDLSTFQNAVRGRRENFEVSLEDDFLGFENAVSGLRETTDGAFAA